MKKKLVVYDFDKTIYDGETGVNFSVFYLKKYPLKSILFLITYSRYLFLYLFKIVNLTKIKEKYFKFFAFKAHIIILHSCFQLFKISIISSVEYSLKNFKIVPEIPTPLAPNTRHFITSSGFRTPPLATISTFPSNFFASKSA